MKKIFFIITIIPFLSFAQYTGGNADGYVSQESVACPTMTIGIDNISGTTVICNGEYLNLQAQSNLPATYQWYYNGGVVVGGTDADMWASLAGDYYVEAIGDCETIQTGTITLTDAVIINSGQISNSQTVCEDEDPIVFISDISGSGEGTITYQWQYSMDEITWLDIAGEINETYDSPILGGIATAPFTVYARRLDFDDCTSDTSNSVFISVTVCSSINDITNNSFIIYPNPAHDFVVVESGKLKVESIEILDVTGKVVKHLIIEQSSHLTIDISSLEQGIYYVRIDEVVQKFVKK